MEIDIFTLFPEAFGWFVRQRHVTNALAHGSEIHFVNYRDHTPLSAGQVDDTPFGGGAGMVLRVDVLESALRARYALDPAELPARRRVIALAPSGRLLDEQLVNELAGEPALTLLCGRYEGFDERILEHFCSDRLSIGRYVVAGGELPAMVVCDTVLRKLPGALGDASSAVEESFSAALQGGPEYPHYTRPADHRGWRVPDVLLSGHHARIRAWRLAQSRARGAQARESAADSEASLAAGGCADSERAPAAPEPGCASSERAPAAPEPGCASSERAPAAPEQGSANQPSADRLP